MGDGRYYTYSQFFDVLFHMGCIIYLAVIITNLCYKGLLKSRLKYVIVILICFLEINISVFLETVVNKVAVGYLLLTIESFMLVIILGLTIIYFFGDSLTGKVWGLIYMGSVIIVIIATGRFFPIKFYSLKGAIYYVPYYVFINCSVILIGIAICIRQLRRRENAIYNIIDYSLYTVIIIPLVIVSIFRTASIGEDFYYYILMISALLIHYLINNEMPFDVLSNSLQSIGNDLDEAIIMVNEKGKWIYSNLEEHPLKQYLNYKETIDLSHIEDLFATKHIDIATREDGFRAVLNGGAKCFNIISTQINHKKGCVGDILLLIDTTEINHLIEELKVKNNEFNDKNKSLKDYSQLVFRYEYEKEINTLTNEVNNKLGHQMIELSLVLQKTCDLMQNHSDDANESIEECIKLAKMNLTNVRKAVTKYKRYFEES